MDCSGIAVRPLTNGLPRLRFSCVCSPNNIGDCTAMIAAHFNGDGRMDLTVDSTLTICRVHAAGRGLRIQGVSTV